MGLFKPAETSSAFLKMGIMGFQGAGKTKTGTKTAIGLIQYMRERGIEYANKPAYFLDLETGSDWVLPDFKRAGIKLETAKTKAFSDLLKAIPEAEANGSILLIDSATHFWKDLCGSYMRVKNRTRLQFEDWDYLKSEWGKFTDLYVNSSLHIILCGRAGYEYDYAIDEETNKKNLEKTGIKMKAEGETGYEPSLLVLMERNTNVKTMKVTHDATVLKDRSTLLDGAEFADPGFDNFLPHIELLNLGGRQLGVDTSRTSDHMIVKDKRDWQPVQREICIDEVQTLLSMHYPSQSAEDKKSKLKAILKHFDATWTEIEKVMPLQQLREGYDSLYRELEGKPSKYGAVIEKDKAPVEMNDSLPEHSAPPAQAEQPAKTLTEKLRAELATCATMADCFSWAAAVGSMEGLSVEDRLKLSNDLLARQQELTAAAAAKEEPAEDPLEKPTVLRRNGKAKPNLTVLDAG